MITKAGEQIAHTKTGLCRVLRAISVGIGGSKILIDDLEALLLSEMGSGLSPGLQIVDRIQQRLTDLHTIANALSSVSPEDIWSGRFEYLTDDLRLDEIRRLLAEPLEISATATHERTGSPELF